MIRNRLEHVSPPEGRNFVVPYRNYKVMSENIYFIHKQYDHLHSCSEDLNHIIKLSVTVTLIATVISTVFLIKTLIVFVLHFNHDRELLAYAAVLVFNRCLKYNAILAILCLTTRLTTSEVLMCRVVIQKMKNIPGLDKEVRRQLKALLQLTTDKEFVYKLFWNIKIDMKLPLNYISICITYLIIVMQFDKFIT